ncbi:MAG: BlaI/MecI/CopY family transcriptional regulator [Oscillospiraceae bacterium]|nr:BlaI/MecI/CopY family transcriptional regulator [Oscillospiraceae bacterium]
MTTDVDFIHHYKCSLNGEDEGMKQIRISDAELVLMEHIWAEEGVRAARLVQLGKEEMGWSRNTTYTLLTRMVEKGIIQRADPGFACTALISKEQVRMGQTHTLIDKLYEGSRQMFLASFLKNEKISAAELEEIRQMIEEEGK